MANEMKGLSRLGGAMGGGKTAAMAKSAPKPAAKMGEQSKGAGQHMELHDHGDGTAHTMVAGEQTEHPDMHHAMAHLAHKAMGGGAHFHAHKDGMGMHSHSIGEGGEHSETTEHGSPEEMHSAMDAAMGEGGGGEEQAPAAEPEGGGLGGFRG